MEFAEKVKVFLDIKGLNNRDLASKIGKSEALTSRWANAKKPSLEFLLSMAKVFPDFDLNYMLRNKPAYPSEDLEPVTMHDVQTDYGKSSMDIINEIEKKLAELKNNIKQSEG